MPDLPKRTLGRTGLDVTVLGYGAMELRGAPRGRDVSDEQAERILNAVLDSGINFIDTSIDYGVAEERIGKYISHRRDEYFLASKCGCLSGAGRQPAARRAHGTLPARLHAGEHRRGLEQSLARMKTDYVDLVQFHSSPSMAQLEEHGALDGVLDLQRQGKVRFIGMSGTIPNLKEQIEIGVFDEFQIPYSAMEREHEDADSSRRPRPARASSSAAARPRAARARKKAAPGTSGRPSASTTCSTAAAARSSSCASRSRHPDMATTIVGTINPDHLRDNVDALLKGPLPNDIYAEAKRRLEAGGLQPIAIQPA